MKNEIENKQKWAGYEGLECIRYSRGLKKSWIPSRPFLQCRSCKQKVYQGDVPGDMEDLESCPRCGYSCDNAAA